MAVINSYQPSLPEDLSTYSNFGPDPYDINFCLPLDFLALENDRVKLVPFIPRLYAQIFLDQILQHPELEKYLSAKPPSCLGEMLYLLESFRVNPASAPLAIIDKGRSDPTHPEWEGGLAGFIALTNTSAQNLTTEVGSVRVFPAFQRTYVTSNAVGMLVRYCLELPSAKPWPGLGLRRVEWGAAARNEPSVKVAERLGFKREGIRRWHKVVYNKNKEGPAPRKGDPLPDRLRSDTQVFSLCADDWEDGGRETVQQVLDRP